MKVALYARTSIRDKGQNLEMQLESLRRYCEVMGWGIYKEYTDKTKASDLDGCRRTKSFELLLG